MKGKWYKNEKVVEKLKVEFEKAGLPLEYRAKKIFEDNGFEAFSQLYKFPLDGILDKSIDEKEGIWRQIDISTIPKERISDVDLRFGKTRIVLTANFIAECKFSSKKSFFLFKSRDAFISNFPLCQYGNNLLPFRISLFDSNKKEFIVKSKETKDYFNFNVYENIVEIDISNCKNKQNNYDDKITYEACEQLYYAANFETISAKNEMKEEISEEIHKSKLFNNWKKYVIDKDIKKRDAIGGKNIVRDDIALKFLRDNFKLTDTELFHMIFLKFPVLIINEQAGLFEVELDENNNILDFKKINYGIYLYVSKRSKPTRRGPDYLGIVICDITYLNELIRAIFEGLKKLGDELKKLIDEKPYLIGYELLFNPEIMDLDDLF